tara:strand:+ start:2090 stop:2356 length:267 start_codon:yes stop_codon:yes gene_type:complete
MIDEDERKVQLSISVTRREQRVIEEYARHHHITRSEAVRKLMEDNLELFESRDPHVELARTEKQILDINEKLKQIQYTRDVLKGRISQ